MSDIVLSEMPALIQQLGLDLTEAQTILLADALSDSNTKNVSLPQFYETAVVAIQQCEDVDECQKFIGMADMIRTYAAQAKDRRMLVTARRMNARAWRRLGELLLGYPEGLGRGRRKPDHELLNKERAHRLRKPRPEKTRADVSREAGLTKGAHAKAVYIGKIPVDLFEDAVESEDSISGHGLMMMERGKGLDRKTYVNSQDGVHGETARRFRKFTLFTNNHLPADLARCFIPLDAHGFATQVRAVKQWLIALRAAFEERA